MCKYISSLLYICIPICYVHICVIEQVQSLFVPRKDDGSILKVHERPKFLSEIKCCFPPYSTGAWGRRLCMICRAMFIDDGTSIPN